ncbi:NAD(P)/FAD-dependent oxidoreductase [Oceanicola sp. S124]|uniref:NAD(P)/FAD-dependent oxidoreductase n=1 Tax=Oceanicola sp. S124 TaxID=1042378 RepID=UPI0002557E41|nr:FAD-dependent oxidoreductase [Oceanicola sp. S124]
MRIAIIGAGIIGVNAALALRAQGAEVTLYDREGVAAGASRGNAGIFADYAVLPEARPGLRREVPRMLLDRNGPLSIRLRYLPKLLPWLREFIREGQPERVGRSTDALAALMKWVRPDWDRVLQEAGCEDLRVSRGVLHLYRSPRAMHATLPDWQVMGAHGVPFEPVMGQALRDLEPAVSRDYQAGVLMPALSHALDPLGLTERLAAHARARGCEFRQTEVSAISSTETGVCLHFPGAGTRAFDRAVIACGAQSLALTRPLGLRVPLESERGYNVTLPEPSVMPGRPICLPGQGYYMTPMAIGLRIGGRVELGGLAAPPRWSRADAMLRHARGVLPGLEAKGAKRWMGHRPSLPDTLPAIGPVPGQPNILTAFGHGHLGLTLAATTGRILAEMIYEIPPEIDPTPCLPSRFL